MHWGSLDFDFGRGMGGLGAGVVFWGFAGLVVPFLGGLTFSVLRALALEFCFFFVGEKFIFSYHFLGCGVLGLVLEFELRSFLPLFGPGEQLWLAFYQFCLI